MAEYTINSKSRNLGYGWSTEPSGNGPYSIKAPRHPDATGGLRAVEEGMAERRRICSGGIFYNEQLFVAGRPVVAYWHWYEEHTANCSYMSGERLGDCGCPAKQGWLKFGTGYDVRDIVRDLREGDTIRVRTTD